MGRMRRSKKRNYTIFMVLAALILTIGYATFAQPLAHRLALLVPDNSRYGIWDGIINNGGSNANDNSGTNEKGNNGSGTNGNEIASNTGNNGRSGNNGNNGGISNKQWDISFIGASKVDSVGNVYENGGVLFNKLFASYNVLFHETGDSITYDFMIKNKGILNAKLDGYDIVTTNESNYEFDVMGLTDGDVLNAGNTAKIRIKTTFIGDPNDSASKQGGKITLSVRYVQK